MNFHVLTQKTFTPKLFKISSYFTSWVRRNRQNNSITSETDVITCCCCCCCCDHHCCHWITRHVCVCLISNHLYLDHWSHVRCFWKLQLWSSSSLYHIIYASVSLCTHHVLNMLNTYGTIKVNNLGIIITQNSKQNNIYVIIIRFSFNFSM